MIVAWIALVLSLAGAWLVAATGRRERRGGWFCFMVANGLWIAHAVEVRDWPLLAMQAAFVATSIRGLWSAR